MSYTLDASALLALIKDEKGADKVRHVLRSKTQPFMHALNFLEVGYNVKKKCPNQYREIDLYLKTIPVAIVQLLTPDITDYAKYLKTKYKLSLADSIGVALNAFLGTTFLTSDRHELEAVAKGEKVKIEFLR
ncbi:MAG: hypothetical protein ACD_28C00426G0005 [uncultured bacterium]|nr:MAG: hypothetical protein ACD_28C00426G0005 [uncultured bacterium]KKT76238.1 MAG: hypothetical protein UW70_C0020G0016 [Candidatus Peregrinibacteria bacterium GW2011_GWA2_44_7]